MFSYFAYAAATNLLAAAWRGSVSLALAGAACILVLVVQGPAGERYVSGFMSLMKWALFPAVLLFLWRILVPHLRSARMPTAPPLRAALWPLAGEGLRNSPIRAVVLTNADVYHIVGLINLREGQPFTIYGGVYSQSSTAPTEEVVLNNVTMSLTLPEG